MNFRILQNILANVLFSFANLSKQFFLLSKVIPTKVLHTARVLLNWNKICCIDLFFASFVKLLNIRLDECSLFLSHLKSVFLIVIGRGQNYPSASPQEDHKQIISCNHKCPGVQIQIWRRTKASLTSDSQVASFFP